MIKEEKLSGALYALQAVLVFARSACETAGAGRDDLYFVMDQAERLPSFIASPTDRTDEYREILAAIAQRTGFQAILTRLDEAPPPVW